MIKKGIKNFFISFKYYLPSLGIISFGLLIGLALFINLARNNINDLINVVENQISSNQTINVSAFKDTVLDSIKGLDWKNFFNALRELFSKSFIRDTLMEAIKQVIGEEAYINAGLNYNVDQTAIAFANGFVSFFICFGIGIISSLVYTKIMIKKDLKMEVPFKKVIFVAIVNYLLNITLVAVATYLLGLFPIGAVITSIIMLFINQGIALFEAYLCRTDRRMRFKKVFTFKTILKLTLTTIILAAITVLLIFVLTVISNQAIGYILSIPLIFIFISVIDFNAYSYIKDYYYDLRNKK